MDIPGLGAGLPAKGSTPRAGKAGGEASKADAKDEAAKLAGSKEAQEEIQRVMAGLGFGGGGGAAGSAQLALAMQEKLAGMIGAQTGFVDDLPAPVRRRVAALEDLQEERDELHGQFMEELAELEASMAM